MYLSRLRCFLLSGTFSSAIPPTCPQCVWGWEEPLAGRLMVVCVLSPGLCGGCPLLLPEWGGKTQFGHLSQQYEWGSLGRVWEQICWMGSSRLPVLRIGSEWLSC